jgi:hypothetical protein
LRPFPDGRRSPGGTQRRTCTSLDAAKIRHSPALRINPQLWSIPSNRFSPTHPAPNPHRWALSCMLGETHPLHRSITNKVTNSSLAAKRRAPRQISPPWSSTAFASPAFPSRPWKSFPIDRRSEGLQMAKNLRRTRKKRIKRNRRMSLIMQHLAVTTD